MKNFHIKLWAILLISLSIYISACKPNFEDSTWRTDVLTPLVNSRLTLEDLLTDSVIQTNPDSSLKIVFTNNIYTFNLDSMVQMPDTTLEQSASLDNITLPDREIVYPVTLGALASSPGAGFTGTAIIAFNGDSLVIPAITNPISSDDMDLDANELFQSVTLQSGFMDIKLRNDLPIDITDLVFLLKNQIDGSVVVQDTFPLIPSKDSVMNSYPLDGQTIYGNLFAKIIQLYSPGSEPDKVLIDTSEALVTTINVHDLVPTQATAIFPEQNIIDKTRTISFSNLQDIKLSKVIAESARVHLEIISTIQDSLFFTFTIPSAIRDGQPFTVTRTVPPAPPGDTSYMVRDLEFSGYELDLRGVGPFEQAAGMDLNENGIIDADTVNTFIQHAVGRIDSTGEVVSLSLSDSIYFNAGILDLVATWGEGYIGHDTTSLGPNTVGFDMFQNIAEGTIDFETVNVSFDVNNGIGANAEVQFTELKSLNSRTGNTIDLINSDINNNITIDAAVDNNFGDPLVIYNNYSLDLNSSNSNIEEFIENLPDRIQYSLKLVKNPNISTAPSIDEIIANPPNFIYRDAGLEANMNIEIPMSFYSNNLTLTDTLPFNLNMDTDQDAINSASFNLIVDNGFPFDAVLHIEALDENGNIIKVLMNNQSATSAILNSDFKVSETTRSVLQFNLTSSELIELNHATQLVIRSSFSTAEAPNYVKVYSYYGIDFKLTAEFNYNVN